MEIKKDNEPLSLNPKSPSIRYKMRKHISIRKCILSKGDGAGTVKRFLSYGNWMIGIVQS